MSLIYSRKASLGDLDQIMTIIAAAKKFLKKNNSPQWQSGYPNAQTIKTDIEKGEGYLLIIGSEIAGYAAVITGQDPNYRKIDGSWQNDTAPYSTIHRICLSNHFRGLHLASYFLANLISLKLAAGIHNFRIDTYKLNQPMQHLATSFGFAKRGIIQVVDPIDPDRYAYELNL